MLVDASQILSLSYLLDAQGNWDIQKLSTFFYAAVIPHVLSIYCLDSLDLPDTPLWRLSGKQSFDIKFAYTSLSGRFWDVEQQGWRTVWSLQVPQRLRFFLWLSLKGKLMTNTERFRHSLCPQPLCPCCHDVGETVLHVLRDCRNAQAVWCLLLPPERYKLFFSSDTVEWLLSNVASHELHSTWDLPWPLLFISTVWQLWKARNDLVFNDICFDAILVHQRSVLWARYYAEKNSSAASSHPASPPAHYWQRPAEGWICLNTDGAISSLTDPLQAELWDILLGLRLAWENGFEKILVQSDNKEAIKRLNETTSASAPCALVRAITKLRNRGWLTDTQ
ncbi:hypothetical protein V6N12_043773 [Hibiscus sabdariffa]|uniref:Reverse transcriptase zinc-binding domain-containing protein n=1 Tax=Hibiscus sabdariffa TaxID=183260 RepID=A0ABR2DFB0_9ROSI